MTKRFYYFATLIVGSIFSLWLVWHFVIDFRMNAPSNPNYPDSFANNVTITIMGNTGHPEYIFSSPYALHYSANDRTDFLTPHLILYQTGQPPWTADADHGKAVNGDETLTVWGNVFLHQKKGVNNPETTIQTSTLTLYPATKTASTAAFISAVQPYANINGIGMRLNLKSHTIDLLSNVHGVYLPQPPQKGEPMHVTSEMAHLDKTTDIATFVGDARLTQGPNSYAAPKIEYHIKNRVVVSPESQHGRTTIVIEPHTLKKEDS